MAKKLILFVTNNYTPYKGGVVSSITAMAKGLRAAGLRIVIVTLDFEDDTPHEFGTIRLECPIKFTYKTNPMAVPWPVKRQLKEIITRLKPAIIHSHHPFLLGATAAELGKKYSIPVVFTYHTQYEQYTHYVPAPDLIMKFVVQKIVSDYCNAVDTIIAPSKSIADQLLQKEVHKPISIIPSCIDERFFQNNIKDHNTAKPCVQRNSLETNCIEGFEYTKEHKQFKLLSVSRFSPEKNIPFLLRVLKELPEHFQLTLIGYGSEESALKDYAFNLLKLSSSRLTFTIKPPKNIIQQAYQQSDLFIFASITETQGLVLAESMACGTPVIARTACGSQDIIINDHNGYLVDNEIEMRDRIIKCAHDRPLLNRLSNNALQTAQNYSSKTVINKLLTTYQSFL